MDITSAVFVKGLNGTDALLEDGIPQVAFLGRSNVGKSSVINSLTHCKGLAITSSFPGRTRQLNVFLINNSVYFVDVPGYGFAQGSKDAQEHLQKMLYWYLFASGYVQHAVVLIIDGFVGPTNLDLDMLYSLQKAGKHIVVVANKVDKIRKPDYQAQLEKLQQSLGSVRVVPYSAEKNIGVGDLTAALLEGV